MTGVQTCALPIFFDLALVADVRAKIDRARDEMRSLVEKVRLLDSEEK